MSRPSALPHAAAPGDVGTVRRAASLPLALPYAVGFLVAVGVSLRLVQYAHNRSLWLDEAFLALNIRSRSFGDLLGVLDFHQGAPAGFLLLERAAVELLGDSEYALRLVPLLFGIAATLVFYRVATRFLPPGAALAALALFAVLPPLIYYSSEVKQYSGDVAAAVLLLFALALVDRARPGLARLGAFALAGAAAVWVSHPAAFVLAGMATALTATAVARRDWKRLLLLSPVYGAWLASFVGAYLVSTRDVTTTVGAGLASGLPGAFAPLPPDSVADVRWFLNNLARFVDTNGLPRSVGALAAVLAVVGAVRVWRASREGAVVLVAPFVFALAASALDRYPLLPRAELFLTPAAVILLFAGVYWVWERAAAAGRIAAFAAGAVLLAVLIAYPVRAAVPRFVQPLEREEIKPVIAYVDEHRRQGDSVYLYYAAQYAFTYYAQCNDCGLQDDVDWPIAPTASSGFFAPALRSRPPHLLVGSRSRGNVRAQVARDVERLAGLDRVWLVFAHTLPLRDGSSFDVRHLFLDRLDRAGTRLDAFEAVGASAYLYELSAPA